MAAAPVKISQLEIKAIDGNYVHLRVDENAPKGITLKPLQSITVDVTRKAVLTISDAGNLEIRWNGTWYAAPGFRGDLKVITLPDQIASLVPRSAVKAIAKPKKPAAVPGVDSSPLSTTSTPAVDTDDHID